MAENQKPDLSIQDLSSMKSIIDVACQRGTFKANEMAQVGQTYDKLETFLNEIARQQEEARKEQESTAGQEQAGEQNTATSEGE